MNQATFEEIKNLIENCQVQQVVDFEEEPIGSPFATDGPMMDQDPRQWVSDRLKDGANLIDLYFMVYADELDKDFWDLFWMAVEETLVEPEHLDEEQ